MTELSRDRFLHFGTGVMLGVVIGFVMLTAYWW